MSRWEPIRPVLDAFRGEQLKPSVILLSSTLLMVTWRYFGSTEFYLDRLSPRMLLWDDPAATAAVYSFASCFVLLGVVPVLLIKLLFREKLGQYGAQLGDRARTVRSILLLAPLFVLGGYVASKDPAVVAEYPINPRAGASSAMFALHTCTYLLYYLGWEFHFRGFLQSGLRGTMGVTNALLVQVLASTLLHIGKPDSEIYGAILGGILWGVLAYRTRSLLSGLVQHFALAVSLDWCICRL